MKHFSCILSLTILFLSLSGCNGENILWLDQNAADSPIGFDGGFVDCSTKAVSSTLADYAGTMGVWGWQTSGADTLGMVFNNQKVSYSPATSLWSYSPLKYWDSKCIYKFLAYSPHSDGTGCIVSCDKGNLKLANVVTHGVNLQAVPTKAEINVFKGTADIDWMIARTGQTVQGRAGCQVVFTMQHILSKFNVRVKVDMTDANLTSVTLNSLNVTNLSANGVFTQKSASTPSPGAAVSEWETNVAVPLKVSLCGPTAPAVLDNEWKYVQESLLVPQELKVTQMLTMKYTFAFKDGNTETYTFTSTLKELFATATVDRFWAGYIYSLSLVIKQDCIEFDAGASGWSDGGSYDNLQ